MHKIGVEVRGEMGVEVKERIGCEVKGRGHVREAEQLRTHLIHLAVAAAALRQQHRPCV